MMDDKIEAELSEQYSLRLHGAHFGARLARQYPTASPREIAEAAANEITYFTSNAPLAVNALGALGHVPVS